MTIADDAFVFSYGPDHQRHCDPDATTHRYSRMTAALGIDTHLHALRHYSATELKMSRVASGASFGKIRELLLPATSHLDWIRVGWRRPRHTHPDQEIDPAVALNATVLYPIRWHPVPDSCISCNCRDLAAASLPLLGARSAPAGRVDLPSIHRGAFAGLEHCSLPVSRPTSTSAPLPATSGTVAVERTKGGSAEWPGPLEGMNLS
jgi:hypothetical protein